MAKKMSEITQKDPSIWQRISSGVSDFFKPKEKTEDKKLQEMRSGEEQYAQRQRLREAQGEYEAQQAKKLEEMRSGEEQYAQRQRQKLAEQEDSGPIAPGVVESGQTTPEQFEADRAYQDWESSQTGYIGKDKKAAMRKLYQDKAYGRISEDEFAAGQAKAQQGQPGFMQRLSSSVSSFPKENPNLTAGLIQGAAGVGGYFATKGSLEEQEALAKRQLASAGRIGERLGQITTTPQFAQQEAELQSLVAGGGMTPEMQLASQMGIRKAGATAAAGRKAAMEMGQQTGTLSGRGAALAGALTAGQMGGNVVADTERQVAADAANRKLQALQQLSGMEQQRFSNVQGLAQAQDTMASSRAAQEALAFGAQRGIEAGKGEATGRLISTGANVLTGAMGLPNFNKQPQTAGITVNVQGQPGAQQGQQVVAQEAPEEVDKSKIAAAKQLSETGGARVVSSGQQAQPKTTGANIAPFNQTNLSPTQKVVSTASNLMNKIPDNVKKQAVGAITKVAPPAVGNLLKGFKIG